jgi:hypothetical protein
METQPKKNINIYTPEHLDSVLPFGNYISDTLWSSKQNQRLLIFMDSTKFSISVFVYSILTALIILFLFLVTIFNNVFSRCGY